jgi:hypothetical protein
MAAQIAIIKFDPPRDSFRAAEKGRADFDGLDFIGRHNDRVKESPALKFEPVSVDAIFLPQTFGSAF